MRLIPLVFTRSYAVKVDRQESISFFMWEYRTCITWSSYQPLTGYHMWSHMTARRQETSIVNWVVGFPLIRATRCRFFNALSDRRFRTNQRADSAYHLISDKAGKWHLILFLETYSQRIPLTSCRQRTRSRVHRRPTATSSSLLASRQALQGSADQRWRRRRWASPLKSSLWLGSTPPLETMTKRRQTERKSLRVTTHSICTS